MRFGRNFPFHQLPRWADSYVNYDEWKLLAKAAKFNELKEAIGRDFLVVKKLLDDNYNAVVQHLSILNDEYGITLDSWHHEVLCSMPIYERDDITAILTDICSLVISLSDYITDTQRAVERINTKTIDTLSEVENLREILQAAATRSVKYLQGLNNVLRNLHLSMSPKEGSTSLLLSKLRSNKSLQTLEEAARALQDSTAQLEKCLEDEAFQADNPHSQLALLVLTKIAIVGSSSKYLPFLVSRLNVNHDFSHYGSRNPLRLHILHAARFKHQDLADQDTHMHRSVPLILDNLPSLQWSNILLCPDSLGRLALHYAAQHGMTNACWEMVKYLDSLQDSATNINIPIFLIPDYLGETSLSIAITQGDDVILKTFLDQLRPSRGQASPGMDKFKKMFHDLVALAIRSERTYITEILIQHESRLVTSDSRVHDLLYLASQYGQASVVARLSTHISDINVGEPLRGRTPLMIASILRTYRCGRNLVSPSEL
ncbi:hypothetical protein F4818DRAFT_194307 [Hypoxylon cercidicola]|nr:hypothetical protein F4818DRAFT_194307 [Hypoxylon cercidicola]